MRKRLCERKLNLDETFYLADFYTATQTPIYLLLKQLEKNSLAELTFHTSTSLAFQGVLPRSNK